jgi:hypothetical protein
MSAIENVLWSDSFCVTMRQRKYLHCCAGRVTSAGIELE